MQNKIIGLSFALAMLWLLAVIALNLWLVRLPLPDFERDFSSRVLDREGQPLSLFLSSDGYWRLETTLEALDPLYIEMLLGYEDRRFYRHAGVDWLALMRAAMHAMRDGEISSGGSTITMQVARLLQGKRTRTFSAKLEQIGLALRLERELDKSEILSLYANLTPMGGNIEGVAAGSYAYFGKPPSHLSAAEAALLIAIPQSPARRTPGVNPEAARAARDQVLARAVDGGIIDVEIADEARQEAMPTSARPMPRLAWHLARRLVGASAKGENSLVTTLDAGVQARLEALVSRTAKGWPDGISAAIIVADHTSGEIIARIGSPDPFGTGRSGYVDMSEAKRSPGSTLKPLIYALGFEDGHIHPETLINDAPGTFDGWAPSNFDGRFEGPISIRRALQTSRNLPAIAVLQALGPARLMGVLRRAGADPILPDDRPAGLAIGLGGVGLSLGEMTSIYAMLANAGKMVSLHEQPLTEALSGPRIFDARTAWYLADILRHTPRAGLGAQDVVAFKTGTSYGYRDAWSIGFDGRHVVAVLIGRPDNGSMQGRLAAEVAAPLMFAALDRLGITLPDRTPPADALILATSALPEPLRVFGELNPHARAQVKITEPLMGAEIYGGSAGQGLYVRIADGTPPFRWLINNAPVVQDDLRRDVLFAIETPGFYRISVIDAIGASAFTQVQLVR